MNRRKRKAVVREVNSTLLDAPLYIPVYVFFTRAFGPDYQRVYVSDSGNHFFWEYDHYSDEGMDVEELVNKAHNMGLEFVGASMYRDEF